MQQQDWRWLAELAAIQRKINYFKNRKLTSLLGREQNNYYGRNYNERDDFIDS